MTNNYIKIFFIFTLFISLSMPCKPVYSEDKKINEVPITLNDSTPLEVDLDTAVNVALQHNRDILNKLEGNTIYKMEIHKSTAAMLPQAGVQLQYQLNSANRMANLSIPGVGQLSFGSAKSQTNTTIGAYQPVMDLVKYAFDRKIAVENFNQSLANTTLTRQFVINDVSGAYFDIIKQQQIIDLNKQNIVALEGYYKVARDNFDNGNALSRDYLKIQYEIDDAKYTLLQDQNNLNILYYKLKDLLGIDLEKEINIKSNYQVDDYSQKPFDELKTIAYDNNQELKEQQIAVKIAKLNKKVAIADFLPSVDTYVGVYDLNGDGMDNIIFGVNGKLLLWDWGSRYFEVKSKSAAIKQEELNLKNTENNIYIDIKTQLNSVNEAKTLIGVAKSNVVVSSESLRITENRFKYGLALIIDLLDDQTNKLDAEVNLVKAQLDYQKSLIELKKTLGILYQ